MYCHCGTNTGILIFIISEKSEKKNFINLKGVVLKELKKWSVALMLLINLVRKYFTIDIDIVKYR